MPKSDAPRLAVLGAGPVGIEAALLARRLGWPVALYERGRLAEHWERWGHVRLFTPFGTNTTALGRAVVKEERPKPPPPADDAILTCKEHIAAYFAVIAATPMMEGVLRTDSQVVAIGKSTFSKSDRERRAQQPFRILLRDSKNNESFADADVVFDCTGNYSRHRYMGAGGLPAPM